MADFYQPGVISTLHRLDSNGISRLEGELERYSRHAPIGLVLPALFSEFETPAMQRIVSELEQVRYLRRIVVALGRANAEQYEQAREFFRDVPTPVSFLWIESERTQDLFRTLQDRGLDPGQDGKGRSCWLAYGFLLASGDCEVIALHDSDILNYSRSLLARLCYPVVHPNLGFEFSKGYYARVGDRLYGRVTRLFMTPLIRAMEDLAKGAPFLRFLDSFRYPLAGEFAMKADLARVTRVPSDWGLEVGILSEIHRNCATNRVCQVDVADNYEHKHQIVSEDDATKGLRRMTHDIAKALFHTMAGEGVVFNDDHFRNLQVRYVRIAEDMINRYYADAMLNGLQFDRHAEEIAVATFAKSLQQAAHDFMFDPLGVPPIPNWNRVSAAIPDFFNMLVESVEADAKSSLYAYA